MNKIDSSVRRRVRYQRAGVVETGLYLASINTAGRLGRVDTAQFIGGRIRQNNKLTPGRADVFLSEAVPARGYGLSFVDMVP